MGVRGESTRLGGLDLLRVVALVAVLLYHADHVVPGGLLGVTVFFTLSGFLITGQLWSELESTGGIDLRRFWSRRIRRLVPASLVTLAAIMVVWPALGYDLAPGEIVGSVLPLRNWLMLWSHTAYGASPSPTSHFWSLAVEEQVYLVLPVLLWAGYRLRSGRGVVSATWFLALCSLGAGALLARGGRLDEAYLATGTRIGEVLVGASVAITMSRRSIRSRSAIRLATIGGTLGLAAVVWSIGVVHWPSTAVSLWAIPLTAVASAGVCVMTTRPDNWFSQLGSTALVRIVADHAYELYLVHIPVYLVVTSYRTGLAGGTLLAARLLATMVLAVALHRLVDPIRRRRWLPSPHRLAGALVSTAAVLAVVVVAYQHTALDSVRAGASGLPGAATEPFPVMVTAAPVSPVSPSEPAAVADRPVLAAAAPVSTVPVSTVPVPAGNSIWIIGDSTLRELDDIRLTAPTLSDTLTVAGWHVTGVVGIRALAVCGERPWDAADDDRPPVILPAVRDVIGPWFATGTSSARTVLIQLGSNDLTQFRFDDGELERCLAATIDALPAGTDVVWSLPTYGPWCWCDVDRAHADARRFEQILTGLQPDRPGLLLIHDGLIGDGLTDSDADPRDVFAEDGVHATREGRALRIAALVRQLGPPRG